MGFISNFAQSSYYYDSSSYSSADASAALALGFGFLMFWLIFAVALYVVSALCLMRIYKKAGIEQPWAAWVPIYNSWKLLEIGGQQGFWAILALIPIVNIVSAVMLWISMYNVGLKLGKEGVFVLLAIFLPLIWLIWLAVDSSTWDESKGAPSLTPVNAATPAAPAASNDSSVPPKPTA